MDKRLRQERERERERKKKGVGFPVDEFGEIDSFKTNEEE
jgi:hypothetical protein